MRRLFFILLFVLAGCGTEQQSALKSDSLSVAIESAQAKFAQRQQDRAYLIQARQVASQALDAAPKPHYSDVLPLTEIYMRTFDYEATHYLKGKNRREDRRRLYQEGIAAVDKYLSPDALKFAFAPYYYFKSLFLIRLSDDSTFMEQLNHMRILLPLLDKASSSVDFAATYEGGGIYRLKAMVKAKEYYKGVPGGTYNPAEALILINLALNAEAYPGNVEGSLYLENYLEKIRVLQRLRAETGDAKYSSLASKLAADSIFDFNDYLRDEMISDQLIFETQEALESIGILEPGAMDNWKRKMARQKELLEDLEVNTDARDAFEALTLLVPAFNAYDKVVNAIVGDMSSLAGLAGSVKVLQQCQEGQEGDPLCDTLLDDLIQSKKATEDQKNKLLDLKDLIDKMPEKAPPTCKDISADECVKTYLKQYLSADDIKTLENARKSLTVIRSAPDQYKKYAARVKEIEEQIEATKHP